MGLPFLFRCSILKTGLKTPSPSSRLYCPGLGGVIKPPLFDSLSALPRSPALTLEAFLLFFLSIVFFLVCFLNHSYFYLTQATVTFPSIYFSFCSPGVEPSTLCMLGKGSPTDHTPNPFRLLS